MDTSSNARLRFLVSLLVLAAAVLLLSPARPAAADEPSKRDVQFWTPTTIQAGLTDRWTVQFETQVKLVEDVRELQNSLLRPSLLFRAGKHTTLTFGYAWVPYFYPARLNEHRAWEQVLVTLKAGRWTLAPRVRFEQRLIPLIDRVSFRLRGQIKAMLPLTSDGTWQLAMSDEIFLHLNGLTPAPVRGFAGNRAQIGLTRRLSRTLSIEPAYLLQFANRPSPLRDEIDHVIMLSTVVRF